MFAHQEKPVSAPGHIAHHLANAGHGDGHAGAAAIAGYVADGNAAAGVEPSIHHAANRFQAAGIVPKPAQVLKRNHHADGAMAAHAQIADVVEVNHGGVAGGVAGLAQERAHHGVVAARFIHHGGAELVEPVAEAVEPPGQRTPAEVRTTRDHHASRLAPGMGVYG